MDDGLILVTKSQVSNFDFGKFLVSLLINILWLFSSVQMIHYHLFKSLLNLNSSSELLVFFYLVLDLLIKVHAYRIVGRGQCNEITHFFFGLLQSLLVTHEFIEPDGK